jgi:hypothetical protein
MRLIATSLCLAGALTAPGCVESLGEEMPVPPDMTALVEAYRNPTAPLDQPTLDALVEPLRLKLDVTSELGDLDYITGEVVEPAVEVAGEEADDPSPFGLRAEGFARIHHVCRGLDRDAPPDPAANGFLELVMTFSGQGIAPIVWGLAHACRMPIEGREVVLDGHVALHLPERIFELAARVEVDGEELVDGGFDVRFAGGIELKLDVADGHVIFFLGADGPGFRAADGIWACDVVAQRCEREGDGALLILEGVSL